MEIVTLEQAGKHLIEEGVVDFENNMTVEGKQLLKVCGYPLDDKVSQHIKRQISKHDFIEGLDFTAEIDLSSKSRRKPKVYQFTLEAASMVFANSSNGTITKFNERKEEVFSELLYSAFPLENIIKQYPVKNKRLDFYLPKHNLAIEYDEKYHKYQYIEDLERQTNIESLLGCKFIRIKEGSEGLGLIQVYEYLKNIDTVEVIKKQKILEENSTYNIEKHLELENNLNKFVESMCVAPIVYRDGLQEHFDEMIKQYDNVTNKLKEYTQYTNKLKDLLDFAERLGLRDMKNQD